MKKLIRYSNRKYYSKDESRYVTCEDIAEWVRRGEDIEVMCQKTKNDVTHMLLQATVAKVVSDKSVLINALKGASNA